MTRPQINLSLLIKENAIMTMLDISLGIYCQGQTKTSIVSLKGINMIGTQEEKYQQDNSFIMLLISTKTWYQ